MPSFSFANDVCHTIAMIVCESTPIEWVTRDDDTFQIIIQTRAWKNGNRMTVREPLVFDSLGQVYWR